MTPDAMESWYKVELSEEATNQGSGARLQDEFAVLWNASGVPRDAAMFSNVSDPPPHVYFFSPGARRMAEILLHRYGAVACDKPPAHQIALLVGHSDATEAFFDSTD